MSQHYLMRKNYDGEPLRRRDLNPDPLKQFDTWFKMVLEAKVSEPNAMVLSTVDEKNCPSSRLLLLKEYDENGFTFFTNYHSHKAHDLEHNNKASILMWWHCFHRQVRITGHVEKLALEISDAYFAIREKASNISAYISHQSEVIKDREELIARYEAVSKQFENVPTIPRPDYWGGYRLIPDQFEFWQGALNRLHDRFLYSKKNGSWVIERLAP
jgi:pyridoxamine 5'-phosphate oxidase